jgi:nuclease-like protein
MAQTEPRLLGLPDEGEEAIGTRLAELAGERLVVLQNRRILASRGNVAHLAVAPDGVFVIDVKHNGGSVEQRKLGNLIRSDVRLYVGGRDRTKLLHGVEEQAEVVRGALRAEGFIDAPVHGVLCFVGAERGLFASPFKLGNVLVTPPKFLYTLLSKEADVATTAIQDAARLLATALPAA